MRETKGKRQSEDMMDREKRRASAKSRLLMMKSCILCTSVDPLMKEKQQHAFPSLALISPLSRRRGVVGNVLTRRLAGGRRTTEAKKKVSWKERKGKQHWEVGEGGYLSFAVVNVSM